MFWILRDFIFNRLLKAQFNNLSTEFFGLHFQLSMFDPLDNHDVAASFS